MSADPKDKDQQTITPGENIVPDADKDLSEQDLNAVSGGAAYKHKID